MTSKSIETDAPALSCDVCGRTLLVGEHGDVFLHEGSRRLVCDLCTARAVHEGWIREGLDDAAARGQEDGGRHRSFGLWLAHLRPSVHRRPPAAVDRPDGGAPSSRDEPAARADQPAGGRQAPAPVPAAPRKPHAVAGSPARGSRRGPRDASRPRLHAVPTNAELKMTRALELFNASPHPRTVSGVARTLGAPVVNVRPSPSEGSVVAIVVGWELSWYRFEVDLADEQAGVRVAAQGAELHELQATEREPNATALDGGVLRLIRAAA